MPRPSQGGGVSPSQPAVPASTPTQHGSFTPTPNPGGFVPGATSSIQRLLAAEDERDRIAARDSASNSAKRKWPRILQGARPWAVRRRGTSRRTLRCRTEALYRATAQEDPGFTLDDDPKVVYQWTLHALDSLQDEAYAMGRAEAEREVTRPLPPEVAGRIMDTCDAMMEALRIAQPSDVATPRAAPCTLYGAD